MLVLIIVTLTHWSPQSSTLSNSERPLCFRSTYCSTHCFSRISSFMTQQLHWLPFTTHIELKVLFLVLRPKSQLGCAPKHLCGHVRSPISASSSTNLLFPTP